MLDIASIPEELIQKIRDDFLEELCIDYYFRPKKKVPYDRREIIRLRREGKSIAFIAKRYNRPFFEIKNFLRDSRVILTSEQLYMCCVAGGREAGMKRKGRIEPNTLRQKERILTLREQGWSTRAIEQKLKMAAKTIRKVIAIYSTPEQQCNVSDLASDLTKNLAKEGLRDYGPNKETNRGGCGEDQRGEILNVSRSSKQDTPTRLANAPTKDSCSTRASITDKYKTGGKKKGTRKKEATHTTRKKNQAKRVCQTAPNGQGQKGSRSLRRRTKAKVG